MNPVIYAIVPTYNGRDDTLALLASLSRATWVELNVVVVDDGSTDGSAEAIKSLFPDVTILHGSGNLWWSGATNLGIGYALQSGAEYVLTLNNDNEVEPSFLEPLIATALAYPKSLVTAKIVDFDQREIISAFGGKISWWLGEIRDCTNRLDEVYFNEILECDFLPGRCTLIPVEVFKEIGLFDNINCPQYLGDTEFSCRAKKHGFQLLAVPDSIVYNRMASAGGTTTLDRGSFREIVFGLRSSFNYHANHYFYKRYCPKYPYQFYLAIRYMRLLYSLWRRRWIDHTRE